jgi:hypothetical protein
MQYKTNISSSQTIRTIIVTKFPNIRSVEAYIAQVHASHILHTLVECPCVTTVLNFLYHHILVTEIVLNICPLLEFKNYYVGSPEVVTLVLNIVNTSNKTEIYIHV